MRHRLKDVAERAGVSVKTVSNVVNGYQHVRADTRADARTNPDADTHANAVAVPGPCECRDNDRTQPGDHDERYGRGLF